MAEVTDTLVVEANRQGNSCESWLQVSTGQKWGGCVNLTEGNDVKNILKVDNNSIPVGLVLKHLGLCYMLVKANKILQTG